MLSALKRRLRESPFSRTAYHATARLVQQARVNAHASLKLRYFSARYFDRLFSSNEDPWSYRYDPVSLERRNLLLVHLPKGRYQRLLELGCAAGWVTERLIHRADQVVAVDISNTALAHARQRCAHASNVDFRPLDLVTEPVPLGFDAIVCAGVLVYVPQDASQRIRDRIVDSLLPGGHLVLEHLAAADPGQLAGREIHDLFARHSALRVLCRTARDGYEIVTFERVARA